jgi:spoIIIJ-associated protein
MDATCERAGNFLQSVLEKAGFLLEVSAVQTEDRCMLNLDGRDAELLQAEGGELLEALQHLINQAFGRSLPSGQRIVCDVHGFRATRETELRAMALHAAAQVRATGSTFTFGSMNAQERRVIHVTLAESDDLETESIGEGSERRLRVGLKKTSP